MKTEISIYFKSLILIGLIFTLSCEKEEVGSTDPMVNPELIVGSWELTEWVKNEEQKALTNVHGYQCDTAYVWTFNASGNFLSSFCAEGLTSDHPWTIRTVEEDQYILSIDVGRSWSHGGYILELSDEFMRLEEIDFNNLGNVSVKTYRRLGSLD